MATNEQQLPEPYTEAYLKGQSVMKCVELPCNCNISNVKSLKKDQLIRAILNIQNQRPQNPQLPQQIEREDSDLTSLVLNERFNGKIQTYEYIPKNESLEKLIQLLYPKLIYVANTHASYKISIDIKATFESSKYDNASFYIQSKRYTRFETDKQKRILQDLQSG